MLVVRQFFRSPSAVYCKFFTQTRVRTEVIFSLVIFGIIFWNYFWAIIFWAIIFWIYFRENAKRSGATSAASNF
jgi:hypothetical protein